MLTEAGQVAKTPEEGQQLEAEDFVRCLNPRCDYYYSPEDLADMQGEYYAKCPRCKMTYAWLDQTPFGGNDSNSTAYRRRPQGVGSQFEPYGQTFVGLTMKQQGDIGENLIKKQGKLPGYGAITWWSDQYNDPVDGGAGDWAIEVKTICIDIKNHRFIPGSSERKGNMVLRAQELGFKGILGLLVIVDYRRSVADVYVREMPLPGGPLAFRKHNADHLLEEIPFDNPFLDPHDANPIVQQAPTQEMPF